MLNLIHTTAVTSFMKPLSCGVTVWTWCLDIHVSYSECHKQQPPCLTPCRGSAGRCWGSQSPQEGRAAQSGLFWSVSSQSDYIRRLLWRLDSLLLRSLHYRQSMCSSSSSSWASLQNSRQAQDTKAGDTQSMEAHGWSWSHHDKAKIHTGWTRYSNNTLLRKKQLNWCVHYIYTRQ